MIITRQGDVAFVKRELPAGANRVKRVRGRLVLAEGEATGHTHAVATPKAELWRVGGEMFLLVPKGGAAVEHEEHSPVALQKGCYEVIRQVEYDGELERRVLD